MTCTAGTARGFTLVELLVALLIFSFLAAASVYTLRLGVEARDQLERADATVGAIEAFRIRLRQDLTQIVARPVRDEFGASTPVWFFGGDAHPRSFLPRDDNDGARQGSGSGGEARLLASFVRDGWTNPQAREPRSSLQFVQYLFRDGALIRRTRPYLDDARGQPAAERVLLDGLSDVRFEFLRTQNAGRLDWVDDWPAGGGGAAPLAVSVVITGRGFDGLAFYFLPGEVAP